MLSCSIGFSAPCFWMGGGLESLCVGRVYGADGVVHHPHRKHELRRSVLTPTLSMSTDTIDSFL